MTVNPLHDSPISILNPSCAPLTQMGQRATHLAACMCVCVCVCVCEREKQPSRLYGGFFSCLILISI